AAIFAACQKSVRLASTQQRQLPREAKARIDLCNQDPSFSASRSLALIHTLGSAVATTTRARNRAFGDWFGFGNAESCVASHWFHMTLSPHSSEIRRWRNDCGAGKSERPAVTGRARKQTICRNESTEVATRCQRDVWPARTLRMASRAWCLLDSDNRAA